jgi:hypothetical protein
MLLSEEPVYGWSRHDCRLRKDKFQLEKARQIGSAVATVTPAAVEAALAALNKRFPDFKVHEPQIYALLPLFSAGTTPDFSLEKYLEGAICNREVCQLRPAPGRAANQ